MSANTDCHKHHALDHNRKKVCLEKECPNNTNQVCATDPCVICYSDLADGPCIKLGCGHVFHTACVNEQLKAKWPGKAISLNYMKCVVCRQKLNHPSLDMYNHNSLQDKIKNLGMLRLQIEGMDKDADIITGGKYHSAVEDYAISHFNFYPCFKCKEPYYGGHKQCGEGEQEIKDEDLKCELCKNEKCEKHGTDYITYKCRYCCTLSVWFCFGTTHFCEKCHSNWTTVTKKPYAELSQCLGGIHCPLDCENHPPSGCEHCLGCSMCKTEELQKKLEEEMMLKMTFLQGYFYDNSFDHDYEFADDFMRLYMCQDALKQKADWEKAEREKAQKEKADKEYADAVLDFVAGLFPREDHSAKAEKARQKRYKKMLEVLYPEYYRIMYVTSQVHLVAGLFDENDQNENMLGGMFELDEPQPKDENLLGNLFAEVF